jgi:adenylate cyclase
VDQTAAVVAGPCNGGPADRRIEHAVGFGYWRARDSALVNAEADMRAFSDRLVDRMGILSGRTTALVGFTASIANSFLVPPPERLDDKITLLREVIAQSI